VLVIDLFGAILQQTFWVLYEGAVFILTGFAIAGAIHVFLDADRIVRYLGARTLGSAFVAALLGAPLPLCSCGVLPTAVSLRRKGASPEATLSFLITTPETGVDSLAMTFAFFGPLMTIVRPLAAIATGLVAASLSLRRWPLDQEPPGEPSRPPETESEHRHASGGGTPEPHDGLRHGHGVSTESDPTAPGGRLEMLGRRAVRYAFVELFDELGFWLVLAIVATGVLSAILPSDFFTRVFPSSFAAMVAMVLLSIPLYVCASASTPLAALFVTKGASAGAALVFLLVGPATNVATLATITRLFGRSFLRTYLGTIIGVAIAAGLLLDLLFPGLGSSVRIGEPAASELFLIPKAAAALVLGTLLFESLRRTGLRPGFRELADNARAAAAAARRLGPGALASSRPVQALTLLWLLSVFLGSFWRVPLGQRAIVQRFGRIAGPPREPGLAFAVPLVDRVDLVAVDAVRERPVGYRTKPGALERDPVTDEALYVTADENVIDLHAEAQYRVADPVRYQLGVATPADVLSALVRARLVEAMAGRSIDLVYTDDRAEVEAWLLERVRRDADAVGLGVEILAVRLLDVHAPATVHDAFRDVASAHEDRLTTIHLANEYAVGLVTIARGDAERIVAEAQAQAVQRVALAEGAAGAFVALAAEHRHSPQLTEDRLYLEAVERVLPGARKLVRAAPGATHGYELWLRGSGAPIVFPPEPAPATPSSQPAAPRPAEGLP
jgi:HflK protein